MTLKDAILKSLDEIKGLANNTEVCNYIIANKYYDFKDAQTPASTVSALLGNFIRNGDSRVKRVPLTSGNFTYYLTKYEQDISLDALRSIRSIEEVTSGARDIMAEKVSKYNTFEERSLHKLLSTYLKGVDIHSKTIFHEQSNAKDSNQKWIHPDMVGIRFLNLHTKASQAFLKAINSQETFELTAYELKKEIKSDYDLKKYFFQAVSNSSWANYGYLVAFQISDILIDEIKRLNQSFGIGIIRLKANPFESEVLFPARHKKLDFITIDKLCKINRDFERFIEQIEKLLTANERYITALEKELLTFCDSFFIGEADIEKYCMEKNIPVEKIGENGLE